MGKEVREKSRFFVVPPHAFPLSVTQFRITQKYPHMSMYLFQTKFASRREFTPFLLRPERSFEGRDI